MARRSLRLRLLVTFGLGALVLSSVFAVLTFIGVRRVLVNSQQQTDLRQSFADAAIIRYTLYTSPPSLANQLSSIEQATNSAVLVHTHHQWLSKSPGAATGDVPQNIISLVDRGRVIQQTVAVGHQLFFIVGIPIPAVETQVFEVFHLHHLESTLGTLVAVLGLGALATALIGVGGGLWVSRRTIRPLQRVSSAAAAVANGELNTRVAVSQADEEVQQLTESFNTMVSRLVDRMERDARFASDVSHELRSPLTTLTTTAAVLQQHRDELSPAGRASLDLLTADLAIFQSLVDDLLEMARGDAGATPHVFETVTASDLVRHAARSAARRLGRTSPPLEIAPEVEGVRVRVDRRRFERVMANLVSNAERYANGVVAIRVSRDGDALVVAVDDDGPGIPPDERERVFERFFRGRAAHDRGMARGTGLGLALVRDHVASFGGTIRAESSPEGGARLVLTLPVSLDVASTLEDA